MSIRPGLCALLLLQVAASGQFVESVITLPRDSMTIDYVGSLAYDSRDNRVFVGGNGILVIDGTTNQRLARIPVDGSALSYNPYNNRLYAAGDSLSIIDAATGAVIRRLPFCSYPEMPQTFAINPTRGKVYSVGQSGIGIIDATGDSLLGMLPGSQSVGRIAYNSRRDKLYCIGGDRADSLFVVDCRTDSVAARLWLQVRGDGWQPLCYDSQDDKMYCGGYNGVAVVDCAADTIIKTIDESLEQLWYDSVRQRVYGTGGDEIAVIDCAGDSVIQRFRPVSIEDIERLWFSSSEGRLYLTSYPNTLTVLDCATGAEAGVERVLTNDDEQVFCENTMDGRVYFADCDFGGPVKVMDAGTGRVMANVSVAERAGIGDLCYVGARDRLYCFHRADWGNYESGGMTVIDGATYQVLGTRVIGVYPYSKEYCSRYDKVYVSDPVGGGIVVIGGARDTVIGVLPNPEEEFGDYLRYHAGVNKLYCPVGYPDSMVAVIDAAADTLLYTFGVGFGVEQLIADTVRNRLFVAGCTGSRATPVVVDAVGDSVITRLPQVAGAELVYSPTQNRLYGLRSDSAFVVVVDCSTFKVMARIPAPKGETGHWDPASDRIYYAARDSVVVIDCANNRLLGWIPVVGRRVRGWESDPTHGRVYCVTTDSVCVIDVWKNSVVARMRGGYPLAWDQEHSRAFCVTGDDEVSVVCDMSTPSDVRVRAVPDGAGSKATVVRRSVRLPKERRAEMLNSAGRRVAALLPGANDVRNLPAGVYFVRDARTQARAVRKVIITR